MKTRHQFGKLIVIRSIYYIAEKYITSRKKVFRWTENFEMDRFHSNRDNALSLVRDLCLHGMQREFRYISSIILVLNWSSDHYKTTQYSVSISIWDHNLETDHATQFVKQKSDLLYYRRIISRLCSQRGMSTTWRSYSTILRYDYQGFILKWTIGGYCGASFTGTQRRRIEYNITVRAEQRRMPVLALEIWRYTDSILWCSKPSWNITLYVRDHIIRTRRHLDR